jgi:dTMP kinase
MENKKNQKFISFEGIDFSGKTTQIQILQERLEKKGFRVQTFRDPGGPRISELIRDILLNPDLTEIADRTEVLLYEAARAQLTFEKIIPALNKGDVVIIDRYFDSTTAYQGYGRGLPIEMIQQLNLFASHELKPTLTFFLDIPTDEFILRSRNQKKDRLETNAISFFTRVRNGYFTIAKKEPNRVIVLDGTQTIEKIADKIWKHVQQKFLMR